MANDPEVTETTFEVTIRQYVDEGTPSVDGDELTRALLDTLQTHDIESITVQRI